MSSNMVGRKIRKLRQSQGRSLADVAGRAKISIATLSRIENDKQSIGVGMFHILARVLHVDAGELLGSETGGPDGGAVDPLARRIASLETSQRAELWRELAAERRTRTRGRGTPLHDLGAQVEELLAQVEFLREELEIVRKRVKRK